MQRDVRSKRTTHNAIIMWLFSLEIPVSNRYNRLYDEYNVFYVMIATMINSATITSCAISVRQIFELSPTSEWFRVLFVKISKLNFQRQFKTIVKQQIKALQDADIWPDVVNIAIDKHKIMRYDKQNKKLKRCKPDKGTDKVTYMTAQVAHPIAKLNLAGILMSAADNNIVSIDKIIDICVSYKFKIGVFLFDREFYVAEIFAKFQNTTYKFLTPCKNTAYVKNCIREYQQGLRSRISQAKITNGKGLTVPFTMIITKNRKGKLMAYATNDPDIDISIYASRWIIESGYRDLEQMRLKMQSKSESVRFMLFLFSMLFYNAWILARHMPSETKGFSEMGKKVTKVYFKTFLQLRFREIMARWPPPTK